VKPKKSRYAKFTKFGLVSTEIKNFIDDALSGSATFQPMKHPLTIKNKDDDL
jgi:hypothetical protein